MQTDLNAELLALLAYGKPRLSYNQSGWMCVIELNTTSKGTQVDVRSDYKHPTPVSALIDCRERLYELLASIHNLPRIARD